ncbi:RNA polymerase sigma-E factor protein [Burkholderiales bacterium]|nr:RNA polymerase sigma-E factor protein [Burkholderiales bacterium]
MLQRRTTSLSGGVSGADAAGASEFALLQRIAAGDRAAFESLYRCYFPRLTRFLERVLRRPHAVEEVLNDAMLVVWRKAASFNGQSKVSTWIFAIAYRRALKAMQRFDDPVEFDAEQAVSTLPGPDRALMQRELAAALDRAMACMSAEHRAVVELTYYQGHPYREIAQIMGCPVDTVKTRMFHARKRLRQLLPDRMEDLP